MNYKSIILTLIAIVAIAAVYNMPAYNEWIHAKIFTVININEQVQHMNPEERKESRFGYSYTVFRDIKEKIGPYSKDAVVLLPPDNYLQAMKVTELKMVEPLVFYYFTGLKSVSVTSPRAWSANWALITQGYGSIALQRLRSRQQLDSLLTLYRKYQH